MLTLELGSLSKNVEESIHDYRTGVHEYRTGEGDPIETNTKLSLSSTSDDQRNCAWATRSDIEVGLRRACQGPSFTAKGSATPSALSESRMIIES